MYRPFAVLGCAGGFLAVCLGAFGSHALRSTLDVRAFDIWQTAVRYLMWHALILTWVASLSRRNDYGKALLIAGWSFVTGQVLFCGSLFILALSAIKGFGMLTPLGGGAFLVGWAFLIYAVLHTRTQV